MGGGMRKPGAVARQHLGVEEGLQLPAPLLRPAGRIEIQCFLPLLAGR
jgi:hypothetical protein